MNLSLVQNTIGGVMLLASTCVITWLALGPDATGSATAPPDMIRMYHQPQANVAASSRLQIEGVADAPDIIVIDELVHYYEPVRFDHSLHVDMSDINGGCENCHHEVNEDETIASCASCHRASDYGSTDAQPSLKGAYHRQCLSCHREWSHINACEYCHAEANGHRPQNAATTNRDFANTSLQHLHAQPTFTYMTDQPGVPVVTFQHADHTDVFGLSCVECHRGQSCGQCHGPEAAPPTLSREETCMKCHAGRKCVFCHDVGTKPRFEHTASAGWSLEPCHDDLRCDECHGPGTEFIAPTSDRCRTCHRGSPSVAFNHAITGVPLGGSHASQDCLSCHRNGTSGTPTCNQCHLDRSYPEFVPGMPVTHE